MPTIQTGGKGFPPYDYDMCKAVDRGMVIDAIRLIEKKGGKSGHWKTSLFT